MGHSSTTLAQALTIVRGLLDEPANANTNFWSDAQLTTYINMACADIQKKSESLEDIQSPSVAVAQRTVPAPTNALRIYRVEFVPAAANIQVFSLEFRGFNEMDAAWGIYQSFESAWPTFYTLWKSPPNLTMYLYPVPAQAGTVNIYFYPQAVPVVATSDTLDVLPAYEDLVWDYTLFRAYQQDQDQRAQQFYTNYMTNIQSLISMSRVFTDQGNYVSVGSANNPAWWLVGSADW